MTKSPVRPDESLTQRTVWILAGKMLAFAFSLAAPLLLVRRLSQAEFGLYKQAFLVVGTAGALLPMGFGMTVYCFFPRRPERRSTIVLNVLLFYAAMGAAAFLVLALAPGLLSAALVGRDAADALATRAELSALSPVIGAVVFFWLFSSFLEAVAIANHETRHAVLFIVAAQLTKSGLLLGAAIIFASVRSLLYAALIQGVLQTTVLLTYVESRFPRFWRSFDWALLKRQAIYAAPYSASALVWSMQTDMHNYFVSHYFGPEGFAIYAVGVFQIPLLGLLSESVASVMIPRVSYLQSVDDRREIIRLTAAAMRKLAVVFFPAYLFLMVAGREFIVTLFTSKYAASWPIFLINLSFVPFSIMPLDSICRAYEYLGRFLTKMRVVSLVLLAGGLWFATRTGDLRMVAGVTVSIYIAENLISAYKAGTILGVSRHDAVLLGDLVKIFAAGAAAGLVTAGVRGLALHYSLAPMYVLAVELTCFGACYALGCLLLKIANDQERAMITGQLRRMSARLVPKNALSVDGRP